VNTIANDTSRSVSTYVFTCYAKNVIPY